MNPVNRVKFLGITLPKKIAKTYELNELSLEEREFCEQKMMKCLDEKPDWFDNLIIRIQELLNKKIF